MVEKAAHVAAFQLESAQGRAIVDADAEAHRAAFAVDAGLEIFAGFREISRAAPAGARFVHEGAFAEVPFGDRRVAVGQGDAVFADALKGAEGDRGIGRAEGGGADLFQGRALGHGDGADDVDVAGLALVDSHATRGVALDVFDVVIAFAKREMGVIDGHVVLDVEEGFAFRILDVPERGDVIGGGGDRYAFGQAFAGGVTGGKCLRHGQVGDFGGGFCA